MPFARQSPLVTLCIGGVFVLVILAHGWLGPVRDLIRQKVAEGPGSSGGGLSVPNPSANDGGVPGAGGNPQIAPGVG